ncbi:four helix bundle protein [Hymenobacter algoricola]|uniref:Four helix bundle protein n=1 Tax=Hymenobacter algoricola TaxID=486267 RepID=A0ABP7MJZ9_9BACT
MKPNAVRDKSFAFASRVVKAYKYLQAEQREYVLSKHLLRSGTSIGANVEEALSGASKADFEHKPAISAKEARETAYWLRLLHENDYLSTPAFDSLHAESTELLKILNSILLTSKHGPHDPNSEFKKSSSVSRFLRPVHQRPPRRGAPGRGAV